MLLDVVITLSLTFYSIIFLQLAQRIGTTTDSLLEGIETGIPEEESILSKDIQQCLSKLSELIQSRLGPAAERSGKPQHVLLVKRYREIVFDLSSDYQKTTATLQRKREHSELLQNANTNSTQNQNDPAMEQLLRERNSINNSMNASQSIIAQASETYSDLRQQGLSMKNVGGAIGRISTNVPSLNRLVDSIRRKRSRDDYIVAGVIAMCICFTLWYVFG